MITTQLAVDNGIVTDNPLMTIFNILVVILIFTVGMYFFFKWLWSKFWFRIGLIVAPIAFVGILFHNWNR